MRLPGFKLRGQESIKTNTGTALTFILSTIVLIYAAVKFMQLHGRLNAQVSSYNESYINGEESSISFRDINMSLAFSFVSYNEGKLIDDPRYVKWIIRTYGEKDGKAFEHILPYHKCT